MLAVVDAKYNFTVIDVGGSGRECDDEHFSNSNFGRMMLEAPLNIPDPVLLPNTEIAVPHVGSVGVKRVIFGLFSKQILHRFFVLLCITLKVCINNT